MLSHTMTRSTTHAPCHLFRFTCASTFIQQSATHFKSTTRCRTYLRLSSVCHTHIKMTSTMLKCSSCKEDKDLSCFTKSKTSRGYNYFCKKCVYLNRKNKNQPSQTPCVSTIKINKLDVVMGVALKYTSNYKEFEEVILSFINTIELDSLCEVSFKLCRQLYPNHYINLVQSLCKVVKQVEDGEVVEHAH